MSLVTNLDTPCMEHIISSASTPFQYIFYVWGLVHQGSMAFPPRGGRPHPPETPSRGWAAATASRRWGAPCRLGGLAEWHRRTRSEHFRPPRRRGDGRRRARIHSTTLRLVSQEVFDDVRIHGACEEVFGIRRPQHGGSDRQCVQDGSPQALLFRLVEHDATSAELRLLTTDEAGSVGGPVRGQVASRADQIVWVFFRFTRGRGRLLGPQPKGDERL